MWTWDRRCAPFPNKTLLRPQDRIASTATPEEGTNHQDGRTALPSIAGHHPKGTLTATRTILAHQLHRVKSSGGGGI